ncbi:MarR family winged helix-turn-helix transcriptional regulator [Amnibacterium kyonggiense]|uniref:MarR family transcriptional regulator n=1 Tax=Amnibacterium kyonggiense TaxID=595671 RepID=A0A4R7FRV0_9MICO|nr:MarR family transcriptional regulator [Amnibacterium kyonggiense]TDS80551.1 MarR family transcriptional regulator [Amnibacterium kyonggiense]
MSAAIAEVRDVRLANESWEALLSAQVAVMRGFAAERMWDEVSLNEYDVLYALKKAGCALRQGDLTKGVLLSQPALSRMIERLGQRGLVTRAPDPDDRRAVLITLTDAGADAQQRVGARHARSVEERMRALTPDQQRQLRDLCALLTTD